METRFDPFASIRAGRKARAARRSRLAFWSAAAPWICGACMVLATAPLAVMLGLSMATLAAGIGH